MSSDPLALNHPWMIAVWPGMGHVALNAGVYMLAKLGMTVIAEFEAGDLFDVEHVEVKKGLIRVPRKPRNRFFSWTDPKGQHDLVVFLGEAQPPMGRYSFCRQIISFAKQIGVERVLTFAAMATAMQPEDESRVFAAATDTNGLEQLKQLELTILQDGHIGGLNGVLLGAAAEAGLSGACLLGEMPQPFAQFPYPKASHGILEVFSTITGIDIDLTELAEQARAADDQIHEILERLQQAQIEREEDDEDDDEFASEAAPEPDTGPEPQDQQKIEDLFARAAQDRSKAFELKRELDRLGLFKDYEDRFLDLFKKPESS